MLSESEFIFGLVYTNLFDDSLLTLNDSNALRKFGANVNLL